MQILQCVKKECEKIKVVDFDIKKLQLPNGRTLEQQMKYEAKRFMNILQEEIDEWYYLYSPVRYQRTYAMKAIYAEDFVDIDSSGTQLTVRLKQTDEAMHKSLWGGGKVNALLLMNEGYQVKSGWHKDIPYFGYRQGGHFLEKAVERFKHDNYFNIEVYIDY